MTYSPGALLTEVPGGSPIGAAAAWVQNILTGSVAVTIAIIAVASVGLMLLGGRIDLRRGASVILGCFVLFGAPMIASALTGLRNQEARFAARPVTAQAETLSRPDVRSGPVRADTFDPYAGASESR